MTNKILTSPSLSDHLLGPIRALPRAIERWLHPWRRALARRRLRASPPPSTVLMICHGNMCRSPYAAAALRKMLPAGVGARIDSAGFIGAHRGPPQEALDVAAVRGVDLRRHKSRMVSSQAVAGAELIVVMESNQAVSLRRFGVPARPVLVLGDLDPGHPATRTIRDPVEQPRTVFAESYERIDQCLEQLLKVAWGKKLDA